MNQVTRHTMAHVRLDRAHLHPPLMQGGRRVLAAPSFEKAAKEGISPDPLGFVRPFIPSSLDRPDTRLRAERIGGSTSRATGWTAQTTHACSDLFDQARISEVIQDSDFRTEIGSRKSTTFPLSLRASGANWRDFATSHRFQCRRQILNRINYHVTPQESSSCAVPRGVLTRGEVAFRCTARSVRFQNEGGDLRSGCLRRVAQGQDRPADSLRIESKLDRVLENFDTL
jgi:hypothetical protein